MIQSLIFWRFYTLYLRKTKGQLHILTQCQDMPVVGLQEACVFLMMPSPCTFVIIKKSECISYTVYLEYLVCEVSYLKSNFSSFSQTIARSY